MATIICENCGTENPDNVKFCKQCGNKLPITVSAASTQSPSFLGEQRVAAGVQMESRYKVLRGIASLLRTIGIALATITIVGGVISFIFLSGESLLVAFGSLILSAISALLTYLFYTVMSELVSVQLDIEENTRRTAFLLEQRFR